MTQESCILNNGVLQRQLRNNNYEQSLKPKKYTLFAFKAGFEPIRPLGMQ